MRWVRGPTIGCGTTATVSLAFHPGTNRPIAAAKSAPVSASVSLLREEWVLSELRDCPRVVDCFGHDVAGGVHNLLLEYLPRGSLHDNLRLRGGAFSVSDTARYARSILEGLSFVHRAGYVHCDVKLRNVLLCDDGEVKIADFGHAKRRGERDTYAAVRGTPMYMSPESVSRNEYEPPTDIWAVGCAVVEMLTGNPPWRVGPGDDTWAIMMRIGFGDEEVELPGDVSDECMDFLRKCLVRDPKERWTADMLLGHPFLAVSDTGCFGSREAMMITPKSVLHYSESVDFEASLSSRTAEDRIGILATGTTRPGWWCGSGDDEGWIPVRGVDCGTPADRIGMLTTGPAPDWRHCCGDGDGWICVRGCA